MAKPVPVAVFEGACALAEEIDVMKADFDRVAVKFIINPEDHCLT